MIEKLAAIKGLTPVFLTVHSHERGFVFSRAQQPGIVGHAFLKRGVFRQPIAMSRIKAARACSTNANFLRARPSARAG
jgi:hypothetical protein